MYYNLYQSVQTAYTVAVTSGTDSDVCAFPQDFLRCADAGSYSPVATYKKLFLSAQCYNNFTVAVDTFNKTTFDVACFTTVGTTYQLPTLDCDLKPQTMATRSFIATDVCFKRLNVGSYKFAVLDSTTVD